MFWLLLAGNIFLALIDGYMLPSSIRVYIADSFSGNTEVKTNFFMSQVTIG
ncbi:MAG: hypothetical protein AB4368_03195 [Xenococcaceae cyanobacterium]